MDVLIKMDPQTHKDNVVYENGKQASYVDALHTTHGMLVASLFFYKKFRKDLESIGFCFNSYDPWVANRMIKEKQHTVRFGVDNLMRSHMDLTLNSNLNKGLNAKYGEFGDAMVKRGNRLPSKKSINFIRGIVLNLSI